MLNVEAVLGDEALMLEHVSASGAVGAPVRVTEDEVVKVPPAWIVDTP
jgi:hypothetical protein